MLNGRLPVLLLILTAVFWLCPSGVTTGAGFTALTETVDERKAILLLIDRVTLEDVQTFAGPVLAGLLERGSMGLMNVRAAKTGTESSYLSLGTGARAAAGWRARLSFNRDEKYDGYRAGEIYFRHMGLKPGAEIMNLSVPELEIENEALKYHVTLGALGESLREAGKAAAVFGNADGESFSRPAVLIAMDRYGLVPFGDVSERMLRSDPAFPFGKRIDREKMTGEVSEALEHVSLIVIDWGDTVRLDEYRERLAPDRELELMRSIFEDLDYFLTPLSALISSSNLLLIAAPSPPRGKGGGGEQLLPLILTGGKYGPGLLISPTTRRPGLVANMDIAPTILEHLNIHRQAGVGGTPIVSSSHSDPVDLLTSMSQRVTRIYTQRPPLLRGYLTWQIVIVLGGMVGLFLRISWLKKILARFLEASMLGPLIFLVIPLHPAIPPPSPTATAVVLVTGVVALLGAMSLLKLFPGGRFLFLAGVGLVTSLGIAADLVNGAALQKISFLGYDPVAGARYYGMGNEYMGVMIGASFLGTAALLEYWNRRITGKKITLSNNSISLEVLVLLVGGYYLAVIFLFASPAYGANVGGSLSVTVAAGVAMAGFLRSSRLPHFADKYALIQAISICLALLFLVISFWIWNFKFNSGEHWHLQAFWEQWRAGGWEGVKDIIHRKIDMNFRLIRYSVWTRALVVFLGLLIFLFFYPVGIMEKYQKEHRFLFAGIISAAAGSVAALLLNDSGVVAAAAALLFAAPPLLVYFLEEPAV